MQQSHGASSGTGVQQSQAKTTWPACSTPLASTSLTHSLTHHCFTLSIHCGWCVADRAVRSCLLRRCAPACAVLQMPTFKDISSGEQLVGPPNISGNLLPMRLLPLENTVSSPGQLQQLLSSYKGSKYLLAIQPGETIPWWDLPERFMAGYKAAPHIAVALASDAKPKDILTAVLEAAYLRRRLREQQQQVLVTFAAAAAPAAVQLPQQQQRQWRQQQRVRVWGRVYDPAAAGRQKAAAMAAAMAAASAARVAAA